MFGRKESIEIKTPAQFDKMRKAGLVVAAVLARLSTEAGPGVTPAQLDAIAREMLVAHGAEPSFLGYYGYPSVICASVNEAVVHGIPSETPLVDGDILSVDFGAIVDGWHGDAAITVVVGTQDQADVALSEATRQGMWSGLATAIAGKHLGDVGAAIEATIRAAGPYGILTDYVGHGIGTKMHMSPDVPNVGPAGAGMQLRAGMAIAIEPMVTRGTHQTQVLADDWTVVTLDGSRAAHWEHTVAITDQGPWVLTAQDGGAAEFAARGVPSPAAQKS